MASHKCNVFSLFCCSFLSTNLICLLRSTVSCENTLLTMRSCWKIVLPDRLGTKTVHWQVISCFDAMRIFFTTLILETNGTDNLSVSELSLAVWMGSYWLCVKMLLGSIKETDGNAMCITESMWLSIPTSGKELTEGFNRPRPAGGGGGCLL